jgi:ElaB/YqjD/DUF883 family membrane-anchored ribosome-binding protein
MTDASQVRLSRARGEADAAKARMMGTVEEVKTRLAPGKLASDAVQTAKNKGIVAADDAVGAVKQRPGLAAGIAGGTALLIARKPIFAAIVRLFRGKRRPDTYKTQTRRSAKERTTEDIDA